MQARARDKGEIEVGSAAAARAGSGDERCGIWHIVQLTLYFTQSKLAQEGAGLARSPVELDREYIVVSRSVKVGSFNRGMLHTHTSKNFKIKTSM
jgi:hypothetical protein